MGSQPEKILQHRAVERIKALSHLFDPDPEKPSAISPAAEALPLPPGLSSRGEAWRELSESLASPFPEVRRLAASALGKMAPEHPPAVAFLPCLLRVARDDDRPQVRQYAVKAIGRYAASAAICLDDLKDISREETAPPYLRSAAAEVVAQIQTEQERRLARTHHWCTRCKRVITESEYARSVDRWGKPYCRHCLDERELENKNFESTVEAAKVRRSIMGTAVQSVGEKQIANFLEAEGIAYVYDERYRIAEADLIRPDFYLPEFDVYIEYFGMDTPEYRDNMLKKRVLYQRTAKKLVSVSYKDNDRLIEVLRQKLSRYIRFAEQPLTMNSKADGKATIETKGGFVPETGGTTASATSIGTTASATSSGTTASATGSGTTASATSIGTTASATSIGTTASATSIGTGVLGAYGGTGGTNAVSESVERVV